MNLVEMVDIHKSFGAVKALDGANMVVGQNEVVGLVGDNAAGKSTLMKVLCGAYRRDSGEIYVDGKLARIEKPGDARRLGIEMVYQDLALANNLDIAANLFMGRETARRGFLLRKDMKRRAGAVISDLGIDMPNTAQLVGTLSGGQRQTIAISRAIVFAPRLVILDEPTANLSPVLADKILGIVLQLKERGHSVVHISHRMDEVRRVSDRIAVMSRGRVLDA